jgi:hypothetical protein
VFAGFDMVFRAPADEESLGGRGAGWLMLRGRGSPAWVRTDWLVRVSLVPGYAGDGD